MTSVVGSKTLSNLPEEVSDLWEDWMRFADKVLEDEQRDQTLGKAELAGTTGLNHGARSWRRSCVPAYRAGTASAVDRDSKRRSRSPSPRRKTKPVAPCARIGHGREAHIRNGPCRRRDR